MDSEPKAHDLMLLHALVDGELGPQERAALAARLAVERDLARAYATLAQLKATIGATAQDAPSFVLPPPRRTVWRRAGVAAAAAALLVAAGAWWIGSRPAPDVASAHVEGPTAITLASLPAGATIPRLDTGGLKLIGLSIDAGDGGTLFTATYRGPHGCRLVLRAWPSGAHAPAVEGTRRHRWETGGLTYELTAFGMPEWRFAIVAGAAEQQTRLDSDHDRIDRRLREANSGAPPCVA